MRHVWQRLADFIESSESKPISFIELDKELVAPPYGIKAGLLPILYIYTYFIYQHDIALYENRVYRPFFNEESIVHFIKRRGDFTIQYFKLQGINESIFSQYNKALYGVEGTGDQKGGQRTLLDLAKPLAKFMAALPLYTQKTKRLPPKALALRQAFNLSKSPVKLIFEEIPKALGVDTFNKNPLDKKRKNNIETLSKELTHTLKIIKYYYSDLLKNEQGLLAQAFSLSKDIELGELRANLLKNISGLEEYTNDLSELNAFIICLIKSKNDEQQWFQDVLEYLGKKSADEWLDADKDQAEYRLIEFSRKINNLERIRKEHQRHLDNEHSDTCLLGCYKNGSKNYDVVFTSSHKDKKEIEKIKASMMKTLEEVDGKELQLATLAIVANEFLSDFSKLHTTINK